MINHVTNPSCAYPHSIVFSSEEIVSVFAQQPRNETFSFVTNNILFAAESVSWIAALFFSCRGVELALVKDCACI